MNVMLQNCIGLRKTGEIGQRTGVWIPVLQKHLSVKMSLFYLKAEKAMATHSSTLAWKIPWMEEPSRLQSMGSL